MAFRPVQWVLVIFYGVSAHRATYGRLDGGEGNSWYTKDYIQLSRRPEFLEVLHQLFPATVNGGRIELAYRWPGGTTQGALDFSSDRWHLKWETRLGAPRAWKMFLEPTEATPETIPGDPSHHDPASAEDEFRLLTSRGAGQPYLIATKLSDEPYTLHLRVYLAEPSARYAWADLRLAPEMIQNLAAQTSTRRHTNWSAVLSSGGVLPSEGINAGLSRLLASADPRAVIGSIDPETGRAVANYLQNSGHGLFFDPARNHDAWLQPAPLSERLTAATGGLLALLESRFPTVLEEDAAAEALSTDQGEVEAFRCKIEDGRFEVPDATATVKTRGSAQKAFADKVKSAYGYRCAITGISTSQFLVASHIVPWSKDQTIRLDPTNGICLSLLIDRAFEKGFLIINDDCTVRINWRRVGADQALRHWLEPYDGTTLTTPATGGPRLEYLRRRRALAMSEGQESQVQVKVIPLDVSTRLNELRALAPGWLEGGGAAPQAEGLDWLAAAFQTRFPDELPSPYLYPTEAGGIQAEWQFGPVDVSLEIDLLAHSAEWHSLNLQTNQAETHELNLDADEDWRWLATAIKRLAGGAA